MQFPSEYPAGRGDNLRSDLRVSVPAEYLDTCAVWFGRDILGNSRMALEQLGRPGIVSRGSGDPTIRIQDISIKGMRLWCVPPPEVRPDRMSPNGVFVYFKLYDPQELTPSRRICMFLGARIIHTESLGGELSMGLCYVSRILPNRDEKSFTFFHVKQYGVTELGRWCDEINRLRLGGTPVRRPEPLGIELEDLLDEIDKLEA